MVMQTLQAQLIERGEQVDQRELAKVATQRAIEQKLLVQEARRFGVEPDELEVARSAQMAEQQAGGRPALEAKLKSAGSNYEQFLNIVREFELLSAFVETQIKPNVSVTEEEIAAYYKDNPEVFEAEDRAHAFHMIFIVGEDADPAALAAARAKAEAARQRAITGEEDFTAVARDLSEGPSAPSGGDLGWVTRGALVSPLVGDDLLAPARRHLRGRPIAVRVPRPHDQRSSPGRNHQPRARGAPDRGPPQNRKSDRADGETPRDPHRHRQG